MNLAAGHHNKKRQKWNILSGVRLYTAADSEAGLCAIVLACQPLPPLFAAAPLANLPYVLVVGGVPVVTVFTGNLLYVTLTDLSGYSLDRAGFSSINVHLLRDTY